MPLTGVIRGAYNVVTKVAVSQCMSLSEPCYHHLTLVNRRVRNVFFPPPPHIFRNESDLNLQLCKYIYTLSHYNSYLALLIFKKQPTTTTTTKPSNNIIIIKNNN